MIRKLLKAGLIDLAQVPKPAAGTVAGTAANSLSNLEKRFDKSRLKAKQSTRSHWGHTWRNLADFFGENRDISTITPAEAETWAEWLEAPASVRPKMADDSIGPPGQALALPTARKRRSNAKQFFKFASKKAKLIAANPFEEINSNAVDNHDREYFVSREATHKVIDQCSDFEDRLIFALARFGGLRCPSEHLALRWDEIYWDTARMLVHAPKTEHHIGKATRLVPIFPELRPYLDEAWERAEEGAKFVIARRRDTEANLRTRFMRFIRRAGLEPWPKLFQNLRSTRQTELEDSFPTHVVCRWLGNSPRVARKTYLQVTEAHFAKAVADVPEKLATRLASQCTTGGSGSGQETTSGARTKEKTPDRSGVYVDSGRKTTSC
jgi:integrase